MHRVEKRWPGKSQSQCKNSTALWKEKCIMCLIWKLKPLNYYNFNFLSESEAREREREQKIVFLCSGLFSGLWLPVMPPPPPSPSTILLSVRYLYSLVIIVMWCCSCCCCCFASFRHKVFFSYHRIWKMTWKKRVFTRLFKLWPN